MLEFADLLQWLPGFLEVAATIATLVLGYGAIRSIKANTQSARREDARLLRKVYLNWFEAAYDAVATVPNRDPAVRGHARKQLRLRTLEVTLADRFSEPHFRTEVYATEIGGLLTAEEVQQPDYDIRERAVTLDAEELPEFLEYVEQHIARIERWGHSKGFAYKSRPEGTEAEGDANGGIKRRPDRFRID